MSGCEFLLSALARILETSEAVAALLTKIIRRFLAPAVDKGTLVSCGRV